MELQVISTGSTGNCYVLWDEGKALLLDAGISIQRIMRAINFQAERVMGCLVTHEHGDHCLAVKDLNQWASPAMAQQAPLSWWRA